MPEIMESARAFVSPEWRALTAADRSVLTAAVAAGGIALIKCTAPDDAREMTALLSEAERQRLAGISHHETANSFIAGRVLIRTVLGAIRDIDPAVIEIRLQRSGKPYTPGDLRFSLTHSGGLLLLSVSRVSEVGVDVDRLERIDDDPAGMARTAFGEPELQEILDAKDPRRAFLVHWTRKESIIKCRGATLAGDMRRIYSGFDTSLLPEDSATRSFVLSEKVIGALSCAGPFPEVRGIDLAALDLFCP